MAEDWAYDPAKREHEIEQCWGYIRERVTERIHQDVDGWLKEVNCAEMMLRAVGLKDAALLLTAASMKMEHLVLLEHDE